MLKSDDLRQQLIDGASDVYANGYSKAYIIQRYADFYQEIRRKRG